MRSTDVSLVSMVLSPSVGCLPAAPPSGSAPRAGRATVRKDCCKGCLANTSKPVQRGMDACKDLRTGRRLCRRWESGRCLSWGDEGSSLPWCCLLLAGLAEFGGGGFAALGQVSDVVRPWALGRGLFDGDGALRCWVDERPVCLRDLPPP